MAKKKTGIKIPTLSSIRKSYDSGLASDICLPPDKQLWLPSRSLLLNYSLGGGIPYGKIMEIFGAESSGKSLIAMDFGYVAQSCGGVVLLNDAEQSFSRHWAEQNKLDISKIEICNEVAVERVSDWLLDTVLYYRSKLTNNEPIVFIQDSLAALDCMDNINSKQTDAKAEMGNRAKAIYKMIRIRNKMLTELGVVSIFINQIRHKVGAGQFEDPSCLHYDTPIPLVGGGYLKIGEIVRDKIQANVWSYNLDTSSFEPKPISGWVKKEPLEKGEKWINIITNGPGSKGGNFGIVCTQEHGILTDRGWVNAKNLTLGDKLISKFTKKINNTLELFLNGVFIGDSSLKIRSENTARLRFCDNENPKYLKWKLGKLSKAYVFKERKTSKPGKYAYETPYEVELALKAVQFKNRDPLILGPELFNPLTLAIWWMDDGHISKRKNPQGVLSISPKRTDMNKLKDLFSQQGFKCSITKKGLRFNKEGLKNLSHYIREYIPGPMQYKILKNDQGFYKDFDLDFTESLQPLSISIKSIKEAGERNYRRKHKYDLTIDGNHNFIAGGNENGFIVHNTTPGGNAMKFYAAQRVGIYAGKQEKAKLRNSDQRVGVNVSIRLIKNKVAPPRPTFKSIIYFNADYKKPLGIDRYIGLPEVFLYEGVVTKKGHGFYFEGNRVATSQDDFLNVIEKDKALRGKLISGANLNTVSKLKSQLKTETINLYPVKEENHERQSETEE